MDNLEQRIFSKLCDATAKHNAAFAPDFNPAACVCVVPLPPAGAGGAPLSRRLTFSSSVWPTLPGEQQQQQQQQRNVVSTATMRLEVAACLVAACNVSDTLSPAPWPSASSADESPLKLGIAPAAESAKTASNNAAAAGIQEISFTRCSTRKSAARSFAFTSIASALACVNNIAPAAKSQQQHHEPFPAALRALHSVHANVLVSYTNQWLADVAASSTPSGSASLAVVFVVGIRLTAPERLWTAPHLRATAADAEASAARQRQLMQAKQEKTRTHVSLVLRRSAAAGAGAASSSSDDESADPWALRGGVWVVHSSASKGFGAAAAAGAAADPMSTSAATKQDAAAIAQKKPATNAPTAAANANAAAAAKKGGALASRLARMKAAGTRIVDEDERGAAAGSAAGDGAGAGGDDEDLVQEGASVVSLRCPLSMQIMTVPVKGAQCEHEACFELSTFVLSSIRDSAWNCPHCDRPAFFSQLHVDELIEAALKTIKQQLLQLHAAAAADASFVSDRIRVFPAEKGRPRRWERYAAAAGGGDGDRSQSSDDDNDERPLPTAAAASDRSQLPAPVVEEVLLDDD